MTCYFPDESVNNASFKTKLIVLQPHELDKQNDIKILQEKLMNFYWINLNCSKTSIQL